ncbi:DEAD/DEAH box helicase [Paenibacillus sp. SYP-B4298]|uniref:DEAD/DEAH box helicase n=1 Tax=Paenibacillus sp. SYP-B4298 TaxID=2996034 RepID=UPI0022DDBA19|nr:DEAD/DEAH box helicase [Paenibacillus sp. SYP-B4298]
MDFELTDWLVRVLCGSLDYERGVRLYRDGRVRIQAEDWEQGYVVAEVSDAEMLAVSVELIPPGTVKAQCSCSSSRATDEYCCHCAAVLLVIIQRLHAARTEGWTHGTTRSERPQGSARQDGQRAGREAQMTARLMELFEQPSAPPASASSLLADSRELLQVEYRCSVRSTKTRQAVLAIELRLGVKRLYIVQDIRQFLRAVQWGHSYRFTAAFTYDPRMHALTAQSEQLLQRLALIHASEEVLRDSLQSPMHASRGGGKERALILPPLEWEALLPLLVAVPGVKLEQGVAVYDSLELAEGPLPIRFKLGGADGDGYELEVAGLGRLEVLEAYRTVIADGKLYPMSERQLRYLAELRQLVESYRLSRIQLPQEQMDAFMAKAMPWLRQLGTVEIGADIAGQVVQAKLQARLYLDRVRNRLLAGLEFQYGDIVIRPLEYGSSGAAEGRILVRDGEREQRILGLLEHAGFARTSGSCFLDEEQLEYAFFYDVLPELETLLEVHATSAVKVRLLPEPVVPAVRAELDERTNWLTFTFSMDGISEQDIRGILQALQEKRRYYRLPKGAFVPLDTADFARIQEMMEDLGAQARDLEGALLRLPALRALRLRGEEGGSGELRRGRALRRFLDNMRNPDNLEFPLPEPLEPVLRDYQKYGYQWFRSLAHYRLGGILADDMGLGKTLQAIAYILSEQQEIRRRGQPAFIVCPASLMYNWRNEMNRFAPGLRVVIQDGTQSERLALAQRLTGAHKGEQVDVVITSYPLLRRDVSLYASSPFHILILDEAQAVKNSSTQTAQAVLALQASYRFALTGTPIENSLEELWSICRAVCPELFPSRSEFLEMRRDQIARTIKPFLLRRLKNEVLGELPEKIESVQVSQLLPEQKRLYVAYLAQLQEETVKHLDKDSFRQERIRILAGLTRLRQLCCHPSLFVEGYSGSSGKFEQLLELLEECRAAGRRVLLFSQFTSMLTLISRELGDQGVPFFYLDGRTPAAERVELCERFNQGQRDVFLLSLKAGGTGLNLTGADTVILYDLWWNPAVEQQAADRAHRIGQRKVVQVIRLVAEGTVEEKMHELQQRKLQLVQQVIPSGQEPLTALTEAEIRELLML